MIKEIKSWFVPPIVIPLGLGLAILIHAIVQALW